MAPRPARRAHRLAACGALLCLLATGALATPPAGRGLEADLLAAKEAAQRGNAKALDAHRARFAGHLLEPYPHYWALSGRVERVDPAEVRAFLTRWPEGPLAESLRREWLKALGNGASWDAFREVHATYTGEDAEIACFALRARLARQDAEALAEARALFASGREAPVACDTLFAAAAEAGLLGPAEAWERLRKLLANGALRDAKRVLPLLGSRATLTEKAIEQCAKDPARFLAASKVLPSSRATQELLVAAVARLARTKPEEAAERLGALGSRLSTEATQFAWGQVAWQAATLHHPRALEWYARAGDAALTDTQTGWRARAALRAGDWQAVSDALRALSPEEARDPAWRYWRARALRALGGAEAGEALMKTVAREPGFYGLLAAEETGATAPPEWNGWRPAPADLERVLAMPGIARALALYRLDLDNEAFREWVFALRGLDDRDLLAAAEVALLAQEPDRAINAAERTVLTHDFAQRYPIPHRAALSAAARQWDLDEAWLYGIIRQESRFVSEARSRVGAQGLMQLMPATARWVARQMAMPAYRPAMLAQPDVNVRMGSYYFRQVLTELGEPLLAAAAYNAGPGRARRWRDARPLEGAIYAETIPFNETRDYVKKVVTNAWYYTHRLSGRTPSMRALVGQVAPRADGNASPSAAAIASTQP